MQLQYTSRTFVDILGATVIIIFNCTEYIVYTFERLRLVLPFQFQEQGLAVQNPRIALCTIVEQRNYIPTISVSVYTTTDF